MISRIKITMKNGYEKIIQCNGMQVNEHGGFISFLRMKKWDDLSLKTFKSMGMPIPPVEAFLVINRDEWSQIEVLND